MSEKLDYTPEEWALLARAPFMTGLIITLASPSGITGVLEESLAVTKALMSASANQTTNPLLRTLIDEIKDSQGQLAKPTERLNIKTAQTVALSTLKGVSALLAYKATAEEHQAFEAWLMEVAKDASEAAKEGGFMGIGGEMVNEAERAALQQIREALDST